jgi:hypothetical protein
MEVRPAEWVGAHISPQDRSPVRRAGSTHPGDIPVFLAARLTQDFLERGDTTEARTWLEWARRFAADLPLSAVRQADLENLVKALNAARPAAPQ